MAEGEAKPDWTGWLFGAGAAAQIAACYGTAYWFAQRLLGGEGFKGVLAGTLGSLFVLLILAAAFSTFIEKFPAEKRETFNRAGIAALLLLVAGFAWKFTLPTLRSDPSTYYYGTATGTYSVTYTDGRKETRSGADLGGEKWDWAVGLYLSSTYALAAGAVLLLSRRIR